jgi:enoyl-[acyl-carrier protein] reductase I
VSHLLTAQEGKLRIDVLRPALKNKKALVARIANEHSIGYGCAKAFCEVGTELAVTFLNDKAKPYVEPLAKELEAAMFLPMDVSKPGRFEAVFDRIERDWGHLDILVHSIAFVPKEDLQGWLLNCSPSGFSVAMGISCHSFICMARRVEPLHGGGQRRLAQVERLFTPHPLAERGQAHS